jgi:hypothetical protein
MGVKFYCLKDARVNKCDKCKRNVYKSKKDIDELYWVSLPRIIEGKCKDYIKKSAV